MEKKISKITVNEFTDSTLITIDCDKITSARIVAYIAALNLEINTPKIDTNDNGEK